VRREIQGRAEVRKDQYRFGVTWVHLAGEDPEHRLYDEVTAVSVQRAIARLLGDLNENGYDRKDVRILEVANRDIA
jgi:hypothetical protein